MARWSLSLRLAAAAIACGSFASTLGGCQQILGIHERTAGAHLSCSQGNCACEAGFADCNGSLKDGCETALATDPSHCGACGAVCANGTCSAGTCACTDGFAECDADPSNGCETQLASSPTSCGVCGHDCLGGACETSFCGPVKLTDAQSPGGVALSGGYVYYSDFDSNQSAPSSLRRVPVEGGTPEVLMTMPKVEPLRHPAVGTDFVLINTDIEIFRFDLGAMQKTSIFNDASGFVASVVLGGNTAYALLSASDQTPLEIAKIDPMTGAKTSVSTDVNTNITALSIANGKPYWINAASTISTIDAGGAGTVLPKSPTSVFDLAADDGYLFVIISPTTGVQFVLRRIDLSDGSTLDTPFDSNYSAIAGSADKLYWVDTGNTLRTWDGTDTKILAQNLPLSFAAGMKADDIALYLGFSAPGGVYRIAR